MAKDILFYKLKQILFDEEWSESRKLAQKLEEVNNKIENRKELQPRVEPILNDKVDFLQQNFSSLFGPQVTRTIKTQIKESQDEVVEALYPIIGKMIKKYIARELELLSEKIDRQLDNAFSWENLWRKIRAWFGGAAASDMIIRDSVEPRLEQILVIEQRSGLLIGSFSVTPSIDQDMTAGMITALKSFASDAFYREAEDLEMIEYETFKLLIRNFQSFYIVAAVSGALTQHFKNHIDDLILDFADKVLNKKPGSTAIEKEMKTYFKKSVDANQ
ncbi:MAG: hypothetical protein MJA30_05660 [Cytophagales bacterium]|nr:hypothetical protein [Cytophagales bacterium]